MERETGIEPATNSLEGCDSTTELLPREKQRSAYSDQVVSDPVPMLILSLTADRCALKSGTDNPALRTVLANYEPWRRPSPSEIVPRSACGEGDAKSETTQQNHDHEPDLCRRPWCTTRGRPERREKRALRVCAYCPRSAWDDLEKLCSKSPCFENLRAYSAR